MADEYELMHHAPFTVTVLDVLTGQRRTTSAHSRYWWEDGNGSCDCNRALLFVNAQNADWVNGRCLGCHRYIIVEASWGGLAGLNYGYPPELLKQVGQ